MKYTLTFITALFISLGSLMASNPEVPILKKKAQQEIQNIVEYPVAALEQGIEGNVYLRVEVKDDGQLNIIQANSPSNELLRGVLDQLAEMNLNPAQYRNDEPFNMHIRFVIY